MLPPTCEGLADVISSLIWIYINTYYGFMYILAVKPLNCINTLAMAWDIC